MLNDYLLIKCINRFIRILISWINSNLYFDQCLIPDGVHVFEHMRLVEDSVTDGELLEESLVLAGAADETVRGQNSVERLLKLVVQHVESEVAPLLEIALIDGEVKVRTPRRNLADPVVQRGRRYNDQVHLLFILLKQMSQKRNRLTCFAKTLLLKHVKKFWSKNVLTFICFLTISSARMPLIFSLCIKHNQLSPINWYGFNDKLDKKIII